MRQERPLDTILLNIELGKAEFINVKQLIDNFANLKVHKIKF